MSACPESYSGRWQGKYQSIPSGMVVIRITVGDTTSMVGRLFQDKDPKFAIASTSVVCPVPSPFGPMVIQYNVLDLSSGSILRTGVMALQASPPFFLTGMYNESDQTSGSLMLSNLPINFGGEDRPELKEMFEF